MKKISIFFVSFLLFICLSFTTLPTADAASKPVKTFKNCTELNKYYPGGVAKTATTKNKGGKTKYKPFVSKKLYDLNKSKDRDKDSIVCER